jgi:hypothetical protein
MDLLLYMVVRITLPGQALPVIRQRSRTGGQGDSVAQLHENDPAEGAPPNARRRSVPSVRPPAVS